MPEFELGTTVMGGRYKDHCHTGVVHKICIIINLVLIFSVVLCVNLKINNVSSSHYGYRKWLLQRLSSCGMFTDTDCNFTLSMYFSASLMAKARKC